MKKHEFFHLDKAMQGRVVVNLAPKSNLEDVKSLAIPLIWLNTEDIVRLVNDNEKFTIETKGVSEDEVETYVLVAETLSSQSGYYYVGIMTVNPDMTFVGFHDLKTVPDIGGIKLIKVEQDD